MGKLGRQRKSDDGVKVHVTPRGGLYVNERELLQSKGAREIMTKMERILRDEPIGDRRTGRSEDGRQERSGER